jgi:hypothetical protein
VLNWKKKRGGQGKKAPSPAVPRRREMIKRQLRLGQVTKGHRADELGLLVGLRIDKRETRMTTRLTVTEDVTYSKIVTYEIEVPQSLIDDEKTRTSGTSPLVVYIEKALETVEETDSEGPIWCSTNYSAELTDTVGKPDSDTVCEWDY